MKAWDDLADKLKAVTSDSEWYLDTGAKITRYNTGMIVIENIMGTGEKYKPLTDIQLRVFEEFGWDAGRFNVCVNEWERKLEGTRLRLKYTTGDEGNAEAQTYFNEILSELEQFKIKFNASLDNK